jgi:hypothetical protein
MLTEILDRNSLINQKDDIETRRRRWCRIILLSFRLFPIEQGIELVKTSYWAVLFVVLRTVMTTARKRKRQILRFLRSCSRAAPFIFSRELPQSINLLLFRVRLFSRSMYICRCFRNRKDDDEIEQRDHDRRLFCSLMLHIGCCHLFDGDKPTLFVRERTVPDREHCSMSAQEHRHECKQLFRVGFSCWSQELLTRRST